MDSLKGTRRTAGVRQAVTLEERFWGNVDKSGECWLWTRYLMPNGYGHMKIKGRYYYVHRVSYTLTKGDIPDGLKVDHTCHTRHCVKPAHLRLATNKQNMENRSGPTLRSKTGVRGVFRVEGPNPWKAQVAHNKVVHYLGVFPTIEKAEEAVVQKRLELFTHNDADRAAK